MRDEAPLPLLVALSVLLVLVAGLMSGLTLAFFSCDQVDLQVGCPLAGWLGWPCWWSFTPRLLRAAMYGS